DRSKLAIASASGVESLRAIACSVGKDRVPISLLDGGTGGRRRKSRCPRALWSLAREDGARPHCLRAASESANAVRPFRPPARFPLVARLRRGHQAAPRSRIRSRRLDQRAGPP